MIAAYLYCGRKGGSSWEHLWLGQQCLRQQAWRAGVFIKIRRMESTAVAAADAAAAALRAIVGKYINTREIKNWLPRCPEAGFLFQ